MELGGEDLDVIPMWEGGARHAHGGAGAVVAPLRKPVLGEVLAFGDAVFLVNWVGVGVGPQIGVAVEWLRVLFVLGGDLVGVDHDLVVFDPGGEFVEALGVVVFGDAGIDAEVPVVDTADQILRET